MHSLSPSRIAPHGRLDSGFRHRRLRQLWTVVILLTLAPGLPTLAVADERAPAATRERGYWVWPVVGQREVVAPFRAPAHDFGAGHRGIDIVASAGASVVSPADGVVLFRGVVVDRPLVTIEHADGLVTTLEPLDSPLTAGDVVSAGDEVGTVAGGGHSAPGTLHVGVRRAGVYIDPMTLFGNARRAVLLPCCAPL